MESGSGRKLSKKNVRKEQSVMERWSNLFQEKWRIWEIQNKICSLSRRVFEYGKKGWLCYGTPSFSGNPTWKGSQEIRSSTSYRSQSREQQFRKPDVIQEQFTTQGIRRRSGYKTTLATVTPIHYDGEIWCISVPTGAFVANRSRRYSHRLRISRNAPR